MTAYVLPCNLPNFQQNAPKGEGWKLVPNEDPRHGAALTWRHDETGKTIVCPSIWYNAPASSYAKALRFNADRSDESATYKDGEGKPWSAGEARHMRQQARRLRAMAALCDRAPDNPAGAINFHGLSDPLTSRDRELLIIESIERGEL